MDPRHPSKLPLSVPVPVPFSPSPYATPTPFPPVSPTTPSTSDNRIITIATQAGATPVFVAHSNRTYPHTHPHEHTHIITHSRTPSYDIARAESHPHLYAQNLTSDQNPAYAAHTFDQRRSSDTNFYTQPSRQISHDSNLARSNTPVVHSLRTLNREMPPPTSPPQPGAKPPQQNQQPHMMYGPPPPRAPPVAVGPPMSFPSGRELPALSSIARTGSSNSSMSISSMLGGPPPALRESQPPPSHYPPHSAAPGSGPGFATAVHASPRMHSAASDYPPFRRPHTPDHQRPYEPRNSPPGHYTPEVPRYSTPSTYSRHPSGSADHGREPGRLPPGPPPRPSSQPKAYQGMPRPMEMGRPPNPEEAYGRRDEMGRPPPGMEYNPERVGLRPNPYDDRYRAERERLGEEQRERERRERAYSGSDSGRHSIHPEYGHREPPRNPLPYGRPPDRDPRERDPRESQGRDPRDIRERDPRDGQWGRMGSDPSYRAPMDHQRPHPEYPPSAQPYPPHGVYPGPPPERYPPASHPMPGPPGQNMPHGPAPYDSPDRARMSLMHAQQQPPHRRQEEGGPPPPTIAYNGAPGPGQLESPRHRNSDDASAPNGQRNLLAIQEMNRKGRISPLPQAVQGAQLQQPGPTGEPGIKSEFGRMFAGIGNGVMGVTSPMTSAAMPFTNASLAKREDPENVTPDSGPEAGGKGTKGRRRKLKDDEGKGDDESSGRVTPAGRAKRPKTHQHQHHHHHQYVGLPFPRDFADYHSHAHHHHHHPPDAAPLSGAVPFKNFKAGAPNDKGLPVPHHHHPPRPMHPHQHQPVKQPVTNAAPIIPPKTKTIVSSKAVFESVSDRPRHHLGDFIYEPGLKAGRLVPTYPTHRPFASNPKPLPWEMIKDNENCILTVKVSRVHLASASREEITSRSYLWGTDIYTDDSDVVAACIHSGWIKGEWSEDVDSSTLDIEQGATDKRRKKPANSTVDLDSEGLITAPPTSGPMPIPAQRDLHVNILILPRLVKYYASTRHGITSREFGGDYGHRRAIHDGISYMIKSVRWVENGAQPQARLRGQARRDRIRKAMREVKMSLDNGNGIEATKEKETNGKVPGGISATWRKKEPEQTEPKTREKDTVEGDKENSEPTTHDTEANEENKEQPKDVEMNDAVEAPTTEAKTDS
ncbi:transcriptional regulatory protein rxt3 [Fusarium flagelliforme]|uniref:Transcriptional regulatory protein rxt3 n=2 Tax=Fusarium flagelliforme TaxID=2675880 RepID=A0A395M8S6_9HYPO|nr:transcriptional regulatory protein rxt3 [Fusarium flagelliforme]